MYKISFQQVNYISTDNKHILHDINFDIKSGSILCIIGPSGSGKSTLLRLINRLSETFSGTIAIGGQPITAVDVIKLRQKVGIVFQTPRLFPGTVEDNILYGPSLRGMDSKVDAARYLDLAGLDASYLTRTVDKLSGGEQQRVSIARSIANDPEILLLDEPTSSLDPALTEQLENTFLQLRNKLGLTLIWVTHNLDQARRVSDTTMLLMDGRVIELGIANEFFNNPSHEITRKFLKTK